MDANRMVQTDLRDFLAEVEAAGELKTVQGAHWDKEMGAVTEVLYREKVDKSPLLLFDNIPGYPKGFRTIYGMLGSPLRLSLAASELTVAASTPDVGDAEETMPAAFEGEPLEIGFNPEFLNRLDEVILFQSLNDADLIQIVELLVQQLNANLAQKAITISVTDEAKKWILDKTLVDRSYGARPLRRALQRYVEDPLSEALIAGNITARPAFLEVYLDQNQLFYRPVSADEAGVEEKAAGILLYSN